MEASVGSAVSTLGDEAGVGGSDGARALAILAGKELAAMSPWRL